MNKYRRKLYSGWLPRWRPHYKVPRKLKKAWRKEILAKLEKQFGELSRYCRLHWNPSAGWTVTIKHIRPAKPGCCEWPNCDRQAFCRSGNFHGKLVCRHHFRITNGAAG